MEGCGGGVAGGRLWREGIAGEGEEAGRTEERERRRGESAA
jgi:hypothetical protein